MVKSLNNCPPVHEILTSDELDELHMTLPCLGPETRTVRRLGSGRHQYVKEPVYPTCQDVAVKLKKRPKKIR